MSRELPPIPRRLVLQGVGGALLALPLLESLGVAKLHAQAAPAPSQRFAIFLRQACGVACEQQTTELGQESEKFWPSALGALTAQTLQGRTLEELQGYMSRLLVVRNCNNDDLGYGDGHANGAMQGLTAMGPVTPGVGGDSEANGESLDHRIGRELNPAGRDSLFLYAGPSGGWLGGACISYRGPNQRRAAIRNPWDAYQGMIGGSSLDPVEAMRVANRSKSVNDLVRAQLTRLMSSSKLASADKQRLETHFASVRDLELSLACQLDQSNEQLLQGESAVYDVNDDGNDAITITKLHMDVAALAVACGYTHSVAIQVGNGNDGSIRYPDPDTGSLMSDNYHYVSHRRQSHDDKGTIIPNSDLLHAKVDRSFAQLFKHLLDRLQGYTAVDGSPLLDQGVAVWYNDNGNGPGHAPWDVPYILAGSCGGYFRQGQCVELGGGRWLSNGEINRNQNRLLNTIGAACGVKNAAGGELDDFGDPNAQKGTLDELKA
jgi:Protein of unknown function (DUF1552)